MSQQLKRTAASFEASLWKREPWTRLRKPPERWRRGWDSSLLLPRRPARCVPSVQGTGPAVPAGCPAPKPEGTARAGPDVTISFCTKQLKKPPARGLDYKHLASLVNTQKPQALEQSSLNRYLRLEPVGRAEISQDPLPHWSQSFCLRTSPENPFSGDVLLD